MSYNNILSSSLWVFYQVSFHLLYSYIDLDISKLRLNARSIFYTMLLIQYGNLSLFLVLIYIRYYLRQPHINHIEYAFSYIRKRFHIRNCMSKESLISSKQKTLKVTPHLSYQNLYKGVKTVPLLLSAKRDLIDLI